MPICFIATNSFLLNAGKNHMVVMPDADLEYVADNFISGAFGDASQRCMAVSVLVPVEERSGDELVDIIDYQLTA